MSLTQSGPTPLHFFPSASHSLTQSQICQTWAMGRIKMQVLTWPESSNLPSHTSRMMNPWWCTAFDAHVVWVEYQWGMDMGCIYRVVGIWDE